MFQTVSLKIGATLGYSYTMEGQKWSYDPVKSNTPNLAQLREFDHSQGQIGFWGQFTGKNDHQMILLIVCYAEKSYRSDLVHLCKLCNAVTGADYRFQPSLFGRCLIQLIKFLRDFIRPVATNQAVGTIARSQVRKSHLCQWSVEFNLVGPVIDRIEALFSNAVFETHQSLLEAACDEVLLLW